MGSKLILIFSEPIFNTILYAKNQEFSFVGLFPVA